jgi:MtN3 and saliva related transmembrane protein
MDAAILGFAAAFLTTIAFVPQAVRTWTTRETRDLSVWWLLTLAAGVACWLVYGLLIGDAPLIAANGITFGLVGVIASVKARNGWR